MLTHTLSQVCSFINSRVKNVLFDCFTHIHIIENCELHHQYMYIKLLFINLVYLLLARCLYIEFNKKRKEKEPCNVYESR